MHGRNNNILRRGPNRIFYKIDREIRYRPVITRLSNTFSTTFTWRQVSDWIDGKPSS